VSANTAPGAWRRRPWLAALLGLLVFPVGFAYVGRLRVALVATVAVLALIAVLGWSGAIQSAAGWPAALAIVAGFVVFQVAYPTLQAWRMRRDYAPRWYNRWYHYPWIALAVLLPLALVLGLRGRLLGYETYRQTSPSMAPGIGQGDLVLVDTRPATVARLARGDVVVFRHPSGATYMKRIVGLPGDRIAVAQGHVLLDAATLAEPYAEYGVDGDDGMGTYDGVVPEGSVFLLGDNRDSSMDSRVEGPYPMASLQGRTTRIWYSQDPARIGAVR
jgi:signal peptidase I